MQIIEELKQIRENLKFAVEYKDGLVVLSEIKKIDALIESASVKSMSDSQLKEKAKKLLLKIVEEFDDGEVTYDTRDEAEILLKYM